MIYHHKVSKKIITKQKKYLNLHFKYKYRKQDQHSCI